MLPTMPMVASRCDCHCSDFTLRYNLATCAERHDERKEVRLLCCAQQLAVTDIGAAIVYGTKCDEEHGCIDLGYLDILWRKKDLNLKLKCPQFL